MSVNTEIGNLPVRELFKDVELAESITKYWNDPQTIVSYRFASPRLERDTIIELRVQFNRDNETFINVHLINVRLTKTLYYWFTAKENVKDEHGQITTERLTRFERYLRAKKMPADTALGDLTFTDMNASENYYKCPFRLNIRKKYGHATLYNLREFRYQQASIADPMNPGSVRTIWYQPKDKEGNRLRLSRKYYRRLKVS